MEYYDRFYGWVRKFSKFLMYNSIIMITSAINQTPNIVIIGSGWATKSFTNTIDKDKYNVKIVSNSDHFIYTPQLANFSVTKDVKDIETDMTNIPKIEFININSDAAVIICLGFATLRKNKMGLKKIPPPIPTIPEIKPKIAPIINKVVR